MQYEYLKILEHVAAQPAHHFHKLRGELEGGALEAQVLGRAAQDEAVVDVNEVALAVEQDVAVVPVLDLQDVAEKGVPG